MNLGFSRLSAHAAKCHLGSCVLAVSKSCVDMECMSPAAAADDPRMEHTTLSHLPDELLENIFVRLPLKYVVRLQCLNKKWRLTIFSNQFQKVNAALPAQRIGIFRVRTPSRSGGSNVAKIFQICVYDVSANEWCKIPLESAPLNLEAILKVDSGIVCWKGFHQIHHHKFSTCNPVMGVWCELPPLLQGPEFPTLEKMVSNTSSGMYKLQVRTFGCTCKQVGCRSVHESVEIFDSSTHSWSIGNSNSLEIPKLQSSRLQVWDPKQERVQVTDICDQAPHGTVYHGRSQDRWYILSLNSDTEGIWEWEGKGIMQGPSLLKVCTLPLGCKFMTYKNYFYVHAEIFIILTVFESLDAPDLKQVRVLTFQTSTQAWDERWPQELAHSRLESWEFETDLTFEPSFSAMP